MISSYDNNGTLSYGISVGAGNDSYVEVAGNIVASGKLDLRSQGWVAAVQINRSKWASRSLPVDELSKGIEHER